MAWSRASRSERATRLPSDWPARRKRVLARDRHACQLRIAGVCVGRATDVDHIEQNDDHSDANLRAACSPCHARRSSQQGTAARQRIASQRFRPSDPVPGLIPRE